MGTPLAILTVKVKFSDEIHMSGQLSRWFPNSLVIREGHMIHPYQKVTPQQVFPEVT
jgi:hypothetical protein